MSKEIIFIVTGFILILAIAGAIIFLRVLLLKKGEK